MGKTVTMAEEMQAAAQESRAGHAIQTFRARIPGLGVIAGLDVGRRRVGVAVSDVARRLAVAALVCPRVGDHQVLREALHARDVAGLVIGWPLHMNGKTSARCQSVRRFVGDLKGHHPWPVLLWDERLTSRGAQRGQDAPVTDAQVAAMILQSALDRLSLVSFEKKS
ncbi:MAG: Holliday junction resolvase RuvX [Pseudomonadota bacterium]